MSSVERSRNLRPSNFFRLVRAARRVRQVIGGTLDVEILGWGFDSRKRFEFLPGNNRTDNVESKRLRQRRKRHATGFSSHHLFFYLSLGIACAAIPSVQAASPAQEAQLEQVGDEFETMMLQMLFKQMQAGSLFEIDGESNPFAPSRAEKIYRSMRDQETMKALAARRSLGVGDMVVRSLKGEGGISNRAPVNQAQGAR